MIKHIQGAALALTVAGFVPGVVCAAALSCQGLLDAAPWLFAALCGAGAVRFWRWSEC